MFRRNQKKSKCFEKITKKSKFFENIESIFLRFCVCFFACFLGCIFMRFCVFVLRMHFYAILRVFFTMHFCAILRFFCKWISSAVDFVGFAVPPVFRQPFLPPSLLSFSAASTSSRLNYFRGRHHPCVCVGGQRDHFWEGAKKYPKNLKMFFCFISM